MEQHSDSQIQYRVCDDTGDGVITVYAIRAGIEVAFVEAHMKEMEFGFFERLSSRPYVEIRYCREGRMEQDTGREFFYLMPGDCLLTVQNPGGHPVHLPLGHYHGISIGISTSLPEDGFRTFLRGMKLEPEAVAQSHGAGQTPVILRAVPTLWRFFEDIYQVPEEKREDYLRIKLPELLYLLSELPSVNETACGTVPRNQVELSKQVAGYISSHLREKITLKDLTARYGVSDTYLQMMFRAVYGMPVISFIRAQKMQQAAQMLIHTASSVGEIAQIFGYENESKFSAAFKRIMGDSPGIYRKEHTKIRIL